jgi:hypothetical protein
VELEGKPPAKGRRRSVNACSRAQSQWPGVLAGCVRTKVGTLFRLKILLLIVALLLLVSVVFSFACGFTFLDTALTIMIRKPSFKAVIFLAW